MLKNGTQQPIIVCLCGSTRFLDEEREAYFSETQAGHIVLSHSGRKVANKSIGNFLDKLHLWKIDLADEILVLNVGGYIGKSTAHEILYAQETGKRIRWLEPITTSNKKNPKHGKSC